MSRIADQVFERLRAGESPTDVRKSVRAHSRFAEGLQEYVAWATTDVDRLQKEIAKLESTRQEISNSNQVLRTENESLRSKNEKLLTDVKKQTDHLGELTGQSTKMEEKMKGLREEESGLVKRGFTEEIMLKLGRSDAESGREMLQRVETTEKYESEEKKLTGALKKLTDECEAKKKEYESLTTKVQDLQKQEQETTNRLKTRQQEERLFEDSVKVTHSLIERYGLRHQDFRNIMRLVTTAGTAGVPIETMGRVKQLLEQYRTLTQLEAAINGRSETLRKLDTEIGKAEERLKTSTEAFADESRKIMGVVQNIQATVKKSSEETSSTLRKIEAEISGKLDKASEKGKREIEFVKEKVTTSLLEAHDKANQTLTGVLNKCNDVLENIRKEHAETAAENSTVLKDSRDKLLEESRSILVEISKRSTEAVEGYKKQMEEWGRIQAQAGMTKPIANDKSVSNQLLSRLDSDLVRVEKGDSKVSGRDYPRPGNRAEPFSLPSVFYRCRFGKSFLTPVQMIEESLLVDESQLLPPHFYPCEKL